MRIGFHVSIAGGIQLSVRRALDVGCNTMQIFSHSPRMWKMSDIPGAEAEAFKKARAESGISPVFVHTSYLINIASGSRELYKKSIAALRLELLRADEIGADCVVMHLGSATGPENTNPLPRVALALKRAFDGPEVKARLLLENTAGQRGNVGSRYEEVAEIIRLAGIDSLGVTVDTCHSFGAGYDFRTRKGLDDAIKAMEQTFGLGRVGLIHLNDSKFPLGSRRDRHEDIGKGFIGPDAFGRILNHPKLREKPFVMETPKDTPDDDRRNMAVAQALIKKRK